MDKITNKYPYFTFPLAFLHVPPYKFKERCKLIIDWSIIEFIDREITEGSNIKKYQSAKKILNFKGGSYDLTIGNKRHLDALTSGEDKNIFTSLRATYLFEARDGKFQPELLLLLAACKSIIGHKRHFTGTCTRTVISRMFGEKGKGWNRFTRYRFDKLFNSAMNKGLITKIASVKGFYISIKYDARELKAAVVDKKKKYYGTIHEAKAAGKEIRELEKQLKKSAPIYEKPKDNTKDIPF